MKQTDVDHTESIIQHIKSLRCRESHYGRNKSIRSYLPPELNVHKLWLMWKEQDPEHNTSSYKKYYSIFSKNFNLGFGNPRSDVCSFCEEKKTAIQQGISKEENEAALKVHELRYKRFYQILKESRTDKNVISVCFDMQQNQPLPKVAIGDAFYKRQLWVYNLTILVDSGTETESKKEDVSMYTWTENLSGRGSNEVASALMHFLSTYVIKKYTDVPTLRLFSDSCPGQNKNKAVFCMLMLFMNQQEVFKTIEYYFPVRGHSFLPPDRVFGRLEQKLRKIEKILLPEGYYKIYKDEGQIRILNKDWFIYNYKELANGILKAQLPFPISKSKVLLLERGKLSVGFKDSYTGNFKMYSNFMKKKVTNLKGMKAKVFPCVSHVSKEKSKDCRELLARSGVLTAEEKEFYETALKNAAGTDIVIEGSSSSSDGDDTEDEEVVI